MTFKDVVIIEVILPYHVIGTNQLQSLCNTNQGVV